MSLRSRLRTVYVCKKKLQLTSHEAGHNTKKVKKFRHCGFVFCCCLFFYCFFVFVFLKGVRFSIESIFSCAWQIRQSFLHYKLKNSAICTFYCVNTNVFARKFSFTTFRFCTLQCISNGLEESGRGETSVNTMATGLRKLDIHFVQKTNL